MSWQADMLGIDMGELFKEGLPTVVEPEPERWVSLATGARLTGYAHETVRRYATQGLIASVKRSGRVMVSEADCLRLRDNRGRLSA